MKPKTKNVVVREEKCSLCKHSVFCVVSIVFRTFATCEGVIFGDKGCGIDCIEEETEDVVDQAPPPHAEIISSC